MSPAKIGKLGDYSRIVFKHSQVDASAQITSCAYNKTRTAGPAISKQKRGNSISNSSSEKSFGRNSLPLFSVISICSSEEQCATRKQAMDGRQS